MYVFENLRVYGEIEKEMIEANVIWVGLVMGSQRGLYRKIEVVSLTLPNSGEKASVSCDSRTRY